MTKNISIAIAFLTGLGMIFIGTRFLLAPETAEVGYGIHFTEQGDYAFHFTKGVRDIFSGLLMCIFVWSKQTKALAITLLVGTIIPIVDMLVVLSKDYNSVPQAIPHIFAIIVCFLFGAILLRNKIEQSKGHEGFAKIIQSSDSNKESVIEYNIVPNEKTPWHYHTSFSEAFKVIKGTLKVGHNNQVLHLQKGDIATIKPYQTHYFHNVSNDECLIEVRISPGNKNFENAVLMLKGLAKDGLASASGVPKKLSDLALFIYLNNSRMVGPQKFAEPLFNYLARRAINNGRLKKLELKYCKE